MGASDKEQEEEKSSKSRETKGDEPSSGGSDRPAPSSKDAAKAKPVENGEAKSESAEASKSEPPKEDVKEKPDASAKTAGAPSADGGEEHDDEEDEEDEAAEDEAASEGMPAAESKPAAKPAPAVKKAAAAKPGAGAARPKARAKVAPAPRQPSGSLTKNMILFIVIIGALAAGFAYLGKEEPQGAPPTPKWNVGQTVDVEITLVPNDVKELACASPDDIAGKHCAFDAQAKPTTKIDPNDDKKLLRPYTTTDRIQFAAAGLWSQDSLSKGKLPTTRFSVKCKYSIDGKLKNPNIRWSAAQPEQWFPQTGEWYAGSVSNCVLAPP